MALAQQGVWVNGSSEGLGEIENKRVSELTGEIIWGKLTHAGAIHEDELKTAPHIPIATYELHFDFGSNIEHKNKIRAYLAAADILYWTSQSHFDFIVQNFPEVRNYKHACGVGHTAQRLKEKLGYTPYLFLSEKDFLST
jgi:hypothetical protein